MFTLYGKRYVGKKQPKPNWNMTATKLTSVAGLSAARAQNKSYYDLKVQAEMNYPAYVWIWLKQLKK